jgi:AraC-like DNA-binding protein
MKPAIILALRHQQTQFESSAPSSRNPFLMRVEAIVANWVAAEWERKESLRTEAKANGWSAERLAKACEQATLTSETLAHAIDKISLSTLRRELKKVGATTPGKLIRTARIRHATKLLTSNRMLIRDVAERAGYQQEKHFATAFHRVTGCSPSDFRKTSIKHWSEE